MVKKRAWGASRPVVSCVGLMIAWLLPWSYLNAQTDLGSSRQEIRFYKINKDGITQRLRFTTRKSREAGCHSLLKGARLYRTMQFGYTSCQVFSQKDCDSDSRMAFKRDKEDESIDDLTQGYGWFPLGEHERGEIIRSWQCE